MDLRAGLLPGGIEGTFLNTRGQRLFYRAYIVTGQPKATLIFQHGYGAHSGVYDSVFQGLQAAGISVFALDAHGFGRSEPSEAKLRCYAQSVDYFADDIYTFFEDVVDEHWRPAQSALVMGGVSMGGMISVLTVMRKPGMWKGLLLLSPSVDVPRTLLLRIMSMIQGFMLILAPAWRVVPAPNLDDVTNDPAVKHKLGTDPLVDLQKLRVRTARTFLDGFAKIQQGQGKVRLPIFAAMSPTDKVCEFSALKTFLSAVSTPEGKVELLSVEGGYHELLLGPERDSVLPACVRWLLRHGRSEANEQHLIVSTQENGLPPSYRLTDLGREQALQAGEELKAQRTGRDARRLRVYSSPLTRTLETAVIVAEDNGVLTTDSAFQVVPELIERNFGSFELQSDENYPTVWAADARSSQEALPGNAESVEHVAERVQELFSRLEGAHKGDDILLVSHGDTLSILWAVVKGLPLPQHRQHGLGTGELRQLHTVGGAIVLAA